MPVFLDACQYRDCPVTASNAYGVLALAVSAEADRIAAQLRAFIASQENKTDLSELHARLTFGDLLWPDQDSTARISELQSKIHKDPLKYIGDPLFYRLPLPTIQQILDLTTRDLSQFFDCILKVVETHTPLGESICRGLPIANLPVDKLIVLFRRNDFNWTGCADQLPIALAKIRKAKEEELARLKS
jgi:hypothetical protein